MFPMSINAYIIGALLLVSTIAVGYGRYEHLQYGKLKAEIELAAKEQELENKAKAKEAAQVNEKVKNDYENRIALIKRSYSGLRFSNTQQTGAISNTTSSTDGTPSDPQFIEKCAITTQQLVSLQAWLNEQIGIYNAR